MNKGGRKQHEKTDRIILILADVMICLVALPALSNLGLPTRPEEVETLSMADKPG
jgi:hypothetical protein